MNIINNYSPAFGKTFIYSSKMNSTQQKLSTQIEKRLYQSKEYKDADASNIDVYILPNMKNEEGIHIRYLDKYSDNFYRKDGKYLQSGMKTDDSAYLVTKRIKNQLKAILKGEIEPPENDMYFKTPYGESDLGGIRPELYEDLSI